MSDPWYDKLKIEVIDPGLDTGCGTAVGVSEGTLRYVEKKGELLLERTDEARPVPRASYEGCPARYCHYPNLNRFVFGVEPDNWLSGVVRKAYVGHVGDERIRRAGASGGVVTGVLLQLLESGRITGAVCLRLGRRAPWLAEPIVARTRDDIIACAQSVYTQTPMNTILERLGEEPGPLAYVGLPDQVAGVRKLQMIGHPSVRHIEWVLGLYMGTQTTFEAVRSFLRSHHVRSENDIAHLEYRAGEWPGHLRIRLKDGRVLTAPKFHYNYLIPLFITKGSLQLCDFTNELTDISVGDAWSPRYERTRGGYSVILARSDKSVALLQDLRARDVLALREISVHEALDMHGHMLDFKKRGSFIRNEWKDTRPDYGYCPAYVSSLRRLIERCLAVAFGLGRLTSTRWIVERLPLFLIGPCFNAMRISWKAVSKPTKRKGLAEIEFTAWS